MTKWRILLGVLAICTAASFNAEAACHAPDRGQGNYGDLGTACDADAIGKPDVRRSREFNGLVYWPGQRSAYVSRMYSFIRGTAAAYFSRREPNATAAEKDGFLRAVLALASTESYFTHYRVKDNRLKMMFGDSMRSYGLMQIHQPSHPGKSQQQLLEVSKNLLYGIEYFYTGWTKAKSARCTQYLYGRLSTFAFSAYSYYNSGSDVCRWNNSRSRYKANDDRYRWHYETKPWEEFVRDQNAIDTVDLECIQQGGTRCLNSSTAQSQNQNEAETTQNQDEQTQTSDDQHSEQNANSEATSSNESHTEMGSPSPALPRVGSTIKAAHPSGVWVRSVPKGSKLTVAQTQRSYEVLDVKVIKDADETLVYIKIDAQGHVGYMYGGRLTPTDTISKWISFSKASEGP